MKYRIAIWGAVGLFVAACWALYFATVSKDVPIGPVVWTLARLSCPIAFASFYFHFGVKLYWVLLANAATYALIGLIVDNLRQRLHHAH